MTTLQPCLSGFCWDIVTRSYAYQRYLAYSREHDLLVDQGQYTDSSESLGVKDYPLVVQKSPLWFRLRKASLGTGSSLGKYLKTCAMYPTLADVTQAWLEKLSGQEKWEPDGATQAHMRWGVNYEEPAALHFAINYNFRIMTVGAIYLPISYIIKTNHNQRGEGEERGKEGKERGEEGKGKGEGEGEGEQLAWPPEYQDGHLLISPDGLVCNPDTNQLLGLLEIKCISPFHHVPEPDGTVMWAEHMERRQWHSADQIPIVYLIQLGLQALAAQCYYPELATDPEARMWFIRWSPVGYSEFSCTLNQLRGVGRYATQLYLQLLSRLTKHYTLNQGLETQVVTNYSPTESRLKQLLEEELDKVREVLDEAYLYHDHSQMYPEFTFYKEFTQKHKFKLSDC